MAKNTRAIFGTTANSFSYTWTTAEADTLNGVLVQNDSPNTAEDLSSILIKSSSLGTPTLTVTAQLNFAESGSAVWGASYKVMDLSATPVNTFAGANGTFEANVRAQDWWKPNHGFRIIIARSSNTECTLTNYAILK